MVIYFFNYSFQNHAALQIGFHYVIRKAINNIQKGDGND